MSTGRFGSGVHWNRPRSLTEWLLVGKPITRTSVSRYERLLQRIRAKRNDEWCFGQEVFLDLYLRTREMDLFVASGDGSPILVFIPRQPQRKEPIRKCHHNSIV